MKKAVAFFTALVLFIGTVFGAHIYINSKDIKTENGKYALWVNEKKFKSNIGIRENLDKDTIPIFGSSEFNHGNNTPYHPSNMFENSKFHPMLIGAGYYQSLTHAITLASIADKVKSKKAVLILSPQWFRKTGVVDKAFASRFSETHYIQMLENDKLSKDTVSYIQGRTATLLEADKTMKGRVEIYNKEKNDSAKFSEKVYSKIWRNFLFEKERFETVYGMRVSGLLGKENQTPLDDITINWKEYMQMAQKEGENDEQNPFYMDGKIYKRIKNSVLKNKGISKDAKNGYGVSPEYDDLRCFLDVCKDSGIQPMLVMMPVNGYYYDYTKFPKEARQKYYQNIRDIADEYGATLADFSGEEYTKYFFEDKVHLARKGWVMTNESLYNFYKKDKN